MPIASAQFIQVSRRGMKEQENMSQMHDFGSFWCDLGTFWSEFRMPNLSVLLGSTTYRVHVSFLSTRLLNDSTQNIFTFSHL